MKKRILITAGATSVPIDKVRAITNIFKGRTGTEIALHFAARGCLVTLLTSNPSLISDEREDLTVLPFKTYDDLMNDMGRLISNESFDAVIHSAAVSDYRVEGAYYMKDGALENTPDNDTKISSDFAELFLKLTPTKKIVDLIRTPWGFKGTLVKFKLQVEISDNELLAIAQKSMKTSDADMIVANCLEWANEKAYIVEKNGKETEVMRNNLPKELFKRIVP